MGRRLRTRVHLVDGQGKSFVFGPGSSVPEWAAAKITNPKAWADDEPAREAGTAPAGTTTPDTGGQAPDTGQVGVTPVEPPRSGKGSGLEAWREYAGKLGWFESIPEDASRDDIAKAIDDERERRAAEQNKE
jgi:hypothetical protein